jgi:hypothetical protein
MSGAVHWCKYDVTAEHEDKNNDIYGQQVVKHG